MAPVAGLAPARSRLRDEALGSLHCRSSGCAVGAPRSFVGTALLRHAFTGKKKILPPGLAPGLRPHLGLHGYKPFVLLYTTGGKMAERGGLAPQAPEALDCLSKAS